MNFLLLITGFWMGPCIQSQFDHHQGFVKESYIIRESGEFRFEREWFQDSACRDSKSVDEEYGQIKLGGRLSGMFTQGTTLKADFSNDQGTDLGAIQIDNKKIRVARGIRNTPQRNTMVGLFEYHKIEQ